jgi:hypothetical protein
VNFPILTEKMGLKNGFKKAALPKLTAIENSLTEEGF